MFGVKESSGRVDQVQKILKLSTKGFIVYSGDDATTLNFMEAGAYGVVSVAAHFVGVKITKMISLFLKHKDTDAREIEDDLKPLFKALFITSNPSPTKAGLRKLGFNVGIPRLPLVDVTDKERNEVESSLKALGIL